MPTAVGLTVIYFSCFDSTVNAVRGRDLGEAVQVAQPLTFVEHEDHKSMLFPLPCSTI